ncbi:TPR-like protein [Pseudovirgaria hyperparasitica]|uniref:TPR-like protein n=1 Tax=Pseudovirgaria hyperparasitica TaxID=470096 RepID=A0A6A6WHN2_9PEZI|nr:TPR-like protein [Pseudovirgaria hyperparasitica]KAF2762313.1 TPR-like protein [Pseudovirgaria hyperparasitica]
MSDPRVLIKEAEALAKPVAWYNLSSKMKGSQEDNYDMAGQKYREAANAYRLQHQYKEAGDTFLFLATFYETKMRDMENEAANMRVEAFNTWRKTHPELAAGALRQVIDHFKKTNLRRASKFSEDLAKLYEIELGDNERALAEYETAAMGYQNDNADALANKNFLKAADLSALAGDYYKAIGYYVEVAKQSISNNLMRYSVKEYLFKAGICHLATNDTLGATNAFTEYAALDNNFAIAREHKLLVDLAEAANEGNDEAFSEALYLFDQMSKLDDWKTAILRRIKENIQNKQEDFS